MPQITHTATAENAQRVLLAVTASGFVRLEGESDIAYVTRWDRQRIISYVLAHERKAAMSSVQPDNSLLT